MSSPLLQGLDAQLDPKDPKWLAEARTRAIADLNRKGLPTKKTEAWRFTPVSKIAAKDFKTTAPLAKDIADEQCKWASARLGQSDEGCKRVFIIEGAVHLPAEGIAGVQFGAVQDANDASFSAKGSFADLNTATFRGGLAITIDAESKIETPIHLVYVGRAGDTDTVATPRTVVSVGARSSATVFQTYISDGDAVHLTNGVTEILVGESAKFEHIHVVRSEGAAKHILSTYVCQEEHSTFKSHAALLGGGLSRSDFEVDLKGDGATVEINGIYVTDHGDHTDAHVKVNHLTTHGTSHVNFSGVLNGASKAVFDAIAIVAKDAQKTSAHQHNRNLILSKGATVHTKPHLEIDADDVKCSHGATIGALDDKQLFYLQSRGIPESSARAMLTDAFLRAGVESMPHAGIAAMVSKLALEKCQLESIAMEASA